MNNMIEDGTGKGYRAKVSSDQRLFVNSVSRSQSQQAILEGLGFNNVTGAITLTSDGESGVSYLKYTGDDNFIIKEIIVILGSSADGTGEGTIRIYKNPTTGTLISSGTAYTGVNRNFGSLKVLSATTLKGAEGLTVTDGSVFGSTSRTSFSMPVVFDADIIVLQNGNSIAITYQPPSGNTSQQVNIVIAGFEEPLL